MEHIEKQEGWVEDESVAREGAYAEKAFRDAEIKYRNELTEEQRKALGMIAGKEGEEAMAAFQKEKSLEDPRIDALREMVKNTVVLSLYLKNDFRESESNPEAGSKKAEAIEDLLKKLSQGELDRVVANDAMDFPAKTEKIQELGWLMQDGVRRARGNQLPKGVSNSFGNSDTRKKVMPDILRGYFATKMMTESAILAIQALAEIATIEGKKPQEVIQEYMPLILELKRSHPEVNAEMIGTVGKLKALDDGMKAYGFLWSPGAMTYVYMGGTNK